MQEKKLYHAVNKLLKLKKTICILPPWVLYKYKCKKHKRRTDLHFRNQLKAVRRSRDDIAFSYGFFFWILSSFFLEIYYRVRIIGSELVLFLSHFLRQNYRDERERKAGKEARKLSETTMAIARAFTLSLLTVRVRLIYFIDFRPAAMQPISPVDYQFSKSNNIISLKLPSEKGPIPFPRAWQNPTAEFMGTPWSRHLPFASTHVLHVCKELTCAPTWNKVTLLAHWLRWLYRGLRCSCDKFSSALTVLRAAAERYFQSFIYVTEKWQKTNSDNSTTTYARRRAMKDFGRQKWKVSRV